MKIDFRQGIVTYDESTGGQAFLQVPVAGTVNIIGEVNVAFAHRNVNYLHEEVNTVSPAWTNVPTSGDAWLYWDIDTGNATVTYGSTTVQPTSGSTQPGLLSTDVHWYDTVNNIMKVYDGTRFLERIRVFAARINGTQLFPVGSNTAKPYAGTQVGLNQTSFAGQILFAGGLPVIVNTSNSFSPPAFGRSYVFATTETEFLTGGAQKVNTIRLESDFTTATASQNLAAYDVVKYNSAGRLEDASYNDVETTTIGIITDDVSINSIATVVLQGVVTNEDWNWTTVGAELFVLSSGELTQDDPNLTTPSLYPVSKPPVGRVLNSKEIIFMQGMGKVGPRGLNPASLSTVGDVVITTVEENQTLVWSGSPQQWRNEFTQLEDLGNVEITNVAPSDALVYTGSPILWRNSSILSANFGSPLTDEDFIQFDSSSSSWVNRNHRDANVGYFGVTPVDRNTNSLFLGTDAGKGVVASTVGSPIGASVTWTLRAGDFDLGDVITLVRRFNAEGVTIQPGPSVTIVSASDGTTTAGSPIPVLTLDNPAQVTLWMHEVVGSPITYGSPLPVGSPGLATLTSAGTDVWLIAGSGFTFT